jgi:hypothetical protein
MDITDKLLCLTQGLRPADPHKNRFIVAEVASTESHYVSETAALFFLLEESSKILAELVAASAARISFQTTADRAQRLSEKMENNIKLAQLKLQEIQHIDSPTCCSGPILDLLQMRLLKTTKEFQVALQKRTKQIRKNKENKNTGLDKVEVVSKDKPTFLEDDGDE